MVVMSQNRSYKIKVTNLSNAIEGSVLCFQLKKCIDLFLVAVVVEV